MLTIKGVSLFIDALKLVGVNIPSLSGAPFFCPVSWETAGRISIAVPNGCLLIIGGAENKGADKAKKRKRQTTSSGWRSSPHLSNLLIVTTGLEFLRDVCIDTHFVSRGRVVRMAQLVVTNPTCIGVRNGKSAP